MTHHRRHCQDQPAAKHDRDPRCPDPEQRRRRHEKRQRAQQARTGDADVEQYRVVGHGMDPCHVFGGLKPVAPKERQGERGREHREVRSRELRHAKPALDPTHGTHGRVERDRDGQDRAGPDGDEGVEGPLPRELEQVVSERPAQDRIGGTERRAD